MTSITIELPDDLAEQLAQARDRLPELPPRRRPAGRHFLTWIND